MIKGIIFDFDNTFYDYDLLNKTALENTFNYISEKYNISKELINNNYNLINKQIKNENNSNNKFNKAIYFKKLVESIKLPLLVINEFLKVYNDFFLNNLKLYDGVIRLLKNLKQKNIKIGILTNNIFLQQYEKLSKLKILEYIDVIISSDEFGEEKPNINIFSCIKEKMKLSYDELAYVGDNFEDDIIPSIEKGMLTIWYNTSIINTKNITKQKYLIFNNFEDINIFFENYFKTINEFIFLSKYFGQSIYNVQGPGGNISIKLDNYLFIKSSGYILGNIKYEEGYCIVDNNKCIEMVKNNENNVKESKIFGYKNPSMETYFHSFMKKYTIHLHFTLSNIFFCSNSENDIMKDFKYNYDIIDYYEPGLELASEIYKKYSINTDIYILKNHGIIITSDEVKDIINYYEYLFNYFNERLENRYDSEILCYKINKLFYDNDIFKIIRFECSFKPELLKNIIYCFPDLAIFIQKVLEIKKLEELNKNIIDCDIIFIEEKVILIANDINKLYSLIEILNCYKILYENNKNKLIEIVNIKRLQNMEEEINRRI